MDLCQFVVSVFRLCAIKLYKGEESKIKLQSKELDVYKLGLMAYQNGVN